MVTTIDPRAIVETGAEIEEGVVIEPYAVVKSHVRLGKGVCIKSHAYIDGYTTIGEGSVVWPGAVIGTMTQDLKYKGEKTYVSIGSRCQIREYVTINSSTGEGDTVSVGPDCLIMAYCHIAHNCQVGQGVIMSNGATLAGHVSVEEYAVIGGMTPIHQRTRVGAYAMVGGMSRITHDIPPFTLGSGVPYRLGGLNLVGLKRHGITLEERRQMTHAFNTTYRQGLSLAEALRHLEDYIHAHPANSRWIGRWVEFCRSSTRGLIDLGVAEHQTASGELCE